MERYLMTQMRILWIAIGLSALGAVLMWFGMFYIDILLYIGLLIFSIGMLLGPATRYIAREDDGDADHPS
jgi:hypothetical protein